ncbi:Zinc finger, RING/FYVE/PHD-type,CTLH/CRA C-terminal to LisH motif domain,LIS1 homology motif,CRA [Cinara cedri]|uniref:Zinc finger, RING/FYVE/PHD-type,CTLH/CRA C-terminal to LisH motif domain,LIS1 homology motif,CRA n=1 Tax=Cinara cedri TaxID=506608 RepID=A0A5E4MT64_9HEMI|nr:Zinc finger, RING/FYVE/PHD-type,CTLH/CRA C-terminal to LisH motif domain,LIS1 homology motif,CRA [Cinara cedri]
MEACMAVGREVDRVLAKFGNIRQSYSDVYQELIDDIEALKNNLHPNDANENRKVLSVLKGKFDKTKEATQRLAIEHRELHSAVSKVGKAIDKNFVPDFSTTCEKDIFENPDNCEMLNKIICQHFYREGMFDIGDTFLEESGITMEPGIRESFFTLNHIKESLKKKDIYPALEWAKENRVHLDNQLYPPNPLIKRISSASNIPIRTPYHVKRSKFSGCIIKPRPKTKKIKRLELAKKILLKFYKTSSLEFKLVQIGFLTIIQQGVDHQIEAVQYARTHFGQYMDKHEKEIQSMMGMLLYIPQGIENSPYAGVNLKNMWDEVYELFTRDACTLLGLSYDSFLTVSINAGCMAIPALLDIRHVMIQRKVNGIWNEKDELPVEIDLSLEHRYHSMFACPILKQQSSEQNPPMRLICGHIISKDAVHKLGTASNKLKCPYCPIEQSSSDVKQICF